MLKEWVVSKSIFYFVFLFGFLLFLNAIFPVQSDDLGAEITGLEGAINSYVTHNSRLGELFRVGWGAVFATTAYFWFINAFIGAVVVLELFVLIFARLPRADAVDLSIFCLFFVWLLIAYRFGSMFFWAAGSYNYLWSYLFILAWLLPFRFYFDKVLKEEKIQEKSSILKCFLLFIGGVLAGWGHELSIIFLFFTLCASVFVKIFKKTRNPLWFYPAFLGIIIGFLILFLAPGPHARCGVIENCLTLKEFFTLGYFGMIERVNFVFNKAGVELELGFFIVFLVLVYCQSRRKEDLYIILCSIALMAFCLIFRNTLLFLLFGISVSLLLAYSFRAHSTIKLSFLLYAFVFLAFLISIGVLFNTGAIPGRAKLHYYIYRFFELVAIVNVLMCFIKKSLAKIQKITIFLGVIVVILVCFECIHMRYKWENMLNHINEQKDLGKTEIIIDKKIFKSHWKGYGDWGNPGKDPEKWPNNIYAKHFGIKSLIAK